jgi:exopolyphosphatase / guanosine-5'-triphosphate,3'-diphosphate pyrophosphatase
VPNIARYHRRALPQPSHPSFSSLDRDARVIVSKLAAILRVANALAKDQLQKVTDLKISCQEDQIALIGQNVLDLAMGRLALAGRNDFFAEIFGKRIILGEGARFWGIAGSENEAPQDERSAVMMPCSMA